VTQREFITAKEAAYLLGVTPKTLDAWRRRGEGPPAYRTGATKYARVRYRVEEVNAWIAAHKRPVQQGHKHGRQEVQHDRDYYRCLDDRLLIEVGKSNPNNELCIALAERLEDLKHHYEQDLGEGKSA
jgi:predicted DNA-binding transcriptional regulator AlpA